MRWPDVPDEQAPEIRFNRNYNPRVYAAPVLEGESMTVPDQHMSIREILDRHMRGLPMKGTVREPMYTGTIIRQIDDELTHLDEMREQLEYEKKQLEKELKAQQDKKDKDAKAAKGSTPQGPAEGGKSPEKGQQAPGDSGAATPKGEQQP